MDQFALFQTVEWFQVGNLQGTHGLNGRREGVISTTRCVWFSQTLSHRAQDAEDLRSIETLTFTMLADAHGCSPLSSVATGEFWSARVRNS